MITLNDLKVKSCFYSQYSLDRLHIFLLLFDWDLFAFNISVLWNILTLDH